MGRAPTVLLITGRRRLRDEPPYGIFNYGTEAEGRANGGGNPTKMVNFVMASRKNYQQNGSSKMPEN